MAGVAIWNPLEIVLMLRHGFPQLACRNDFGNGFAGPETGSVDVGDRVFRDLLLLRGGIEDRRSIAAADVVALAITRARVVDLEEELEELPIADARGIKGDLHCFRMSGMMAIGRVGVGAAGIADPGRQNAGLLPDEILRAPEAAARENSTFLCHWTSSNWFK